MADPVSVAGSALGVISIAIQVCQGLLSYYNAWRSYDVHVSHVYNKIHGLNATLQNLQSSFEKLDSTKSPAVQNVLQSITSCDAGVDTLRITFEKFRSIKAPQGVREKLHSYSRQTMFPFKQDTLQSMKAIVTDLQNNLDSALQVLELYVNNSFANIRRATLIKL